MDTSVTDLNTKLAEIYYNRGKPLHLVRVQIDVTFSRLKDQLNLINHKDTRWVDDVEYLRPSTNSTRRV